MVTESGGKFIAGFHKGLVYDAVLRVDRADGVSVVCHAGDTLALIVGYIFERTRELAQLGLAIVVDKIYDLGLRIAPHNTEALWFRGLPRSRELHIRVGDTEV